MCDTIVATTGTTSEGLMLFGKNSDRYRNEAQVVEYVQRSENLPGKSVQCTYIEIPQVARTHAVLLCRPFWIWGAEMGANEHGVVIGNEGVQARTPAPEQESLIGMDLLRLALERGGTAEEAVSVLTGLLEQYGQGGNCGYLKPAFYNNSYIIADRTDAFVLETVGREWLLEKVHGVRSISNLYSIGDRPERISKGLLQLIADSGWQLDASPNYRQTIGNPESQHIGQSAARWARSSSLLESRSGQLEVADMISILRDHGPGDLADANWHPRSQDIRTLCLHAGDEHAPAQTTGSLVSEIRENDVVHWLTGTAAPCTSIFKPILMDVPQPQIGPAPSGQFDRTTLWWRHEKVHRAAALGDFGKFIEGISAERDALEANFRAQVRAVLDGGSSADRAFVVTDCWRRASELEDRWYASMSATSTAQTPYSSAWQQMNQLAGLDV